MREFFATLEMAEFEHNLFWSFIKPHYIEVAY